MQVAPTIPYPGENTELSTPPPVEGSDLPPSAVTCAEGPVCCSIVNGSVHCVGHGYTTDVLGVHTDHNQMMPCPACNTVLWLANAKNRCSLPIATPGSEQDTERLWLDALRVAYRENPEGVHAALEELGAVEVRVLVPGQAEPAVRRYNSPCGAREARLDDAAIDAFSLDLKVKMARNRAKGRAGWHDKGECSADFLSEMLREHMDKGDPLDIAILSMMLHQRGELICPSQSNPVPVTNPV